MKLTWLRVGFAHNELLLDESLWIDRAVCFLLSAKLGHICVSASEEFVCSILRSSLIVLSLLEGP